MKKFSAVLCGVVACFAFLLCACNTDSTIADPSASANLPSEISSSSFNLYEYRTCDQKYEGKYLLYQYKEWDGSGIANRDVFVKCENGEWSRILETGPENETGGDVILAVLDSEGESWKCNAEKEGKVQRWSYVLYSSEYGQSWADRFARCEQGDWVVRGLPDLRPSPVFNPDEYRTCDQKYEGRYLLYQYSANYWMHSPHPAEVKTILGAYYKCENGKWSEFSYVGPENKTGGDVVLVVTSDEENITRSVLECNAENEGLLQYSYGLTEYSYQNTMLEQQIYVSTELSVVSVARCEQGDWVVCKDRSSSSSLFSSSSGDATESSSSVAASSSSHEILVGPCKTETEDNCEYGTLTDERDGKTYKTVKIHNKWWMAENLDYADSAKTPSLEGKSWCYADDPENCAKYGRLYMWSAATAACPDKWHLPDHDEWYGLLLAVGGYTTAGVVLKSQSGWSSGENSVSGTDAFGFNALPAGIMFGNGTFNGLGDGTDFWSTEESLGGVVAFYLSYDYEYAGLLNYDKNYAFSVRCVMD